jgi:hypothetical protein
MYTPNEMMVLPLDNGKLVIDLRQNFELNMQNANEHLILNLKIYNTINDQIIFEKSASRFGTISISN